MSSVPLVCLSSKVAFITNNMDSDQLGSSMTRIHTFIFAESENILCIHY